MLIELNDKDPMHSIEVADQNDLSRSNLKQPSKTFEKHNHAAELNSIFNEAKNPDANPEESNILNNDIPAQPAAQVNPEKKDPQLIEFFDSDDENHDGNVVNDNKKMQLHIEMINKEFQEDSDYQEIKINESDNDPLSKIASNNGESHNHHTDQDADVVVKSDNEDDDNQSLVYCDPQQLETFSKQSH